MSLHRTPQEHEADPPSAWAVAKVANRCWQLRSSFGWTVDTYTSRKAAEADRSGGRWVGLFEREGRWFAGQPVAGWRPYAPVT